MTTSGGSPASRERAMRSCTMLKASIITREMPGLLSVRPNTWRCSSFFTARPLRASRPSSRAGSGSGLGWRPAASRGAARPCRGRTIGVDVDGDHVARAERAADRDRDRIDQRAVEQPAAVDGDGAEDAGQRVGGAHGVDEAAARQPDLVAGADLGGDRNEALGQAPRLERPSSAASRTSHRRWPVIRPEPEKLKSRKPSTLRRVRSRANCSSASSSPAT